MAQTTTKKTTPKSVITPKFRVSFPNVLEPQDTDDGRQVWGLTGIFDSDADLSAMEELAEAAKYKKFPNFDSWSPIQKSKFKSPFRPGESHDLEKYPEYEGKTTAGMRNYNQAPGLLNAAKQPITDKREFYSGCYAIAEVTAYAYDNKGGKGVAFGLSNVMKIHDGAALASGVKAEIAFKDIDPGAYGAFDNVGELQEDSEEEEI